MGKPFEVKEFDSIICNADYKDDEKYKYLNQKEFDNLVAFIHEFTGDADSADALDFMKIGYRRNVGEVVSIKNYVGLIQMKNCECSKQLASWWRRCRWCYSQSSRTGTSGGVQDTSWM